MTLSSVFGAVAARTQGDAQQLVQLQAEDVVKKKAEADGAAAAHEAQMDVDGCTNRG